jgi:tRNA pseudouridine synthase 10
LAAEKKFSLCSTCSKRQSDDREDEGAKNLFSITSSKECFICRGLTLEIPRMERLVLRRIRPYQFRTFSVGMIIPEDVQEREDQLRSELRIRGRETIKSQLAREISHFVEKQVHKRIDRKRPELQVLVDFANRDASATSKSLFVHARYTKPRGVAQRREFCERCSGRGCEVCKGGGYSDAPNMEEILGRRLSKVLRSTKAKFTWMGSEDEDSVVYPPGRPFIVEAKDPKLREVPKRMTLVTGRGKAQVVDARVLRGRPRTIPSFVFQTRAFIESSEQTQRGNLNGVRKFRKMVIEYRNNKGKTVEKNVYAVAVGKRRGRRGLVAEIKLDGGLPVKRFVSGESVSPSLSEFLGVPLVCERFDILRVWESGPVRY